MRCAMVKGVFFWGLAGGIAPAADFYVDAIHGSDTSGNGSAASPWQTITFALQQGPSAGDTLHVLPGTYDTALGETFPLNLPAGLTVEGAGPSVTVLDGDNTNDVVKLASNTTLRALTVRESSHGWWNGGVVHWSPGSNILVERVVFTHNERGLHLWNGHSSVTIRDCVFVENGNDALSCFASTAISVLGCTFANNLKGMIFDASSGEVRGCIVTGSGNAGIQNSTANPSILTLSNNLVFGNAIDYDNVAPGPNSLSANPLYANPATGDLHIAPISPAVNAGFAAPALGPSDIDGDPRVVGASPDIGADERPTPDFVEHGEPRLGFVVTFDFFGAPSSPFVFLASPAAGNVPTPFGALLLNPGSLFVLFAGSLSPSGVSLVQVLAPSDPVFVDATIYLQEFGQATGGALALSTMRSLTLQP